MQELLPRILDQLAPSNIASLRKLAEATAASAGAAAAAEEGDDDIPDAVDVFEAESEDK